MARSFQFCLIPIFLGASIAYFLAGNKSEATFWSVLGIVQTIIFIAQKRYNQ